VTSARFAAALLGLALCAGSGVAAEPQAGTAAGAPRRPVHVARARGRRPQNAPACSTISGTFIGLDGDDYAGAVYSGVAAGEYNGSCDQADIVAGGAFNVIYQGNDFGFIGAGQGNVIEGSANDEFIGGGENNNLTSQNSGGGDSGIVAGNGNQVPGTLSFDGAGSNNNVNGSGSAVVAGASNGTSATDAGVVAGSSNNAGGEFTFVGAGSSNTAGGDYSFVGGGSTNTASNTESVVVGGYENMNAGPGSFLGAGGQQFQAGKVSYGNSISPLGIDAFIGAGDANTVNSLEAFIGGGQDNRVVSVNGSYAFGGAFGTVVGGYGNSIVSYAGNNVEYGFIGGGATNAIHASYGTVAGGYKNLASGVYAAVPGGLSNTAAGTGSFAAGIGSDAASAGSFAWSDDATNPTQVVAGANQFVARASGGVKFYSNATLTSGVTLAPGSGAWGSLSDRAMKTNVVSLDDDAVLARVAKLPISEWSYRTQDGRIRHAGPMAQDFYAAFGLGEDGRHITSIDEDGVALAAIKALERRERAADARNQALERQVAELAAAVRRLSRGNAH
jgi:hypothetical protein